MKKLIQQLVKASYVDDVLHEPTVNKIAAHLTRNELKEYIRGLKEQEKRTTLFVTVPHAKTQVNEDELGRIFGQKKVVVQTDPDLLLGLKITDRDDVYNMNLKTSLERITDYAAE
jgi:F0F1-type ATP synthase delta subunit